jgi:hypothetical protein
MRAIETCMNEKENENYRSVTDKTHVQTKNCVFECSNESDEYIKSYFYHHEII